MAKCKVCGEDKTEKFFSFGKQPMGNAFLREDQFTSEQQFSLDMGFCTNCRLVQQINPPPLYTIKSVYQNYAYVPVGNTLQSHYANLGKALAEELSLTNESFVLDIGSNDGTLLKNIRLRTNCRILGVEPALQISEIARESGVPTITSFFDNSVASDIILREGNADLITVTQVIQHIPDLLHFVGDIERLLKPDATFVIEGRYFVDTLKKSSFDTIYHEMLYFFTLTSIQDLLGMAGMEVFKAKEVDIYGGSLRVYAKKMAKNKIPVDKSIVEILENERPYVNLEAHRRFAQKTLEQRKRIQELVTRIKSEGKTIAGYGAPSTGTTLLHFCGLGRQQIEYIVDDNPLKQGLFTPGTHIPILPSSELKERPPDYLFIVAWRLADEIVAKVRPQLKNDAKIILPLPETKIMT